MSKDSSGESLEAILASIRRSLSEQATSVLEEEAVAPVELLPSSDPSTDLDMPPIPASLAQRLGVAPDARPGASTGSSRAAVSIAEARGAAGETATAVVAPTLTVVPAVAVSPVNAREPTVAPPRAAAVVEPVAAGPAARTEEASAAAAVASPVAEPAQGQKDPLWFLSQEPGPPAASQPAGAPPPPEPKPARTSDAKSSRLGVARGPLAPFFGSSAEIVKVEFVPDPPVRQGPEAVAPPTAPLDGSRTVNGATPGGQDGPRAADGAEGMRTSSIFGPPLADARTGAAGEAPQPQIQALEAMVAELLRPMLRRWLDENMPRLVSAALKAEADLMSRRDPGRDPKKP